VTFTLKKWGIDMSKMKAVCPNNPNHTRFATTAHVVQEWEVDADGNFIDVITDCLEVASKPDRSNIWECMECATEAVHVEAK
jgi:hypothetical protein